MPDTRPIDWAKLKRGPTDSARVYWVGHSLLNHRDREIEGAENAMEMVARFAASATLTYASFDHTHFGAPLSLLWRGEPHSYSWSVPEMVERRRELETKGDQYDALVLTEGIPVHRTITTGEFSAYYAQVFYCTLVKQNPKARVYLYESWNSFQAGDRQSDYGPHYRWDWRQRLSDDRPHWERMADLASTTRVPAPGFMASLKRWFGNNDGGCAPVEPIFLVPVGTVMGKLYDQLKKKPEQWPLAQRAMQPKDLFQNPFAKWPKGWPLGPDAPAPADAEAMLKALPLVHPESPPDDVHPSQLGVYIVALTHYAVIFRRSPVGLPTVDGIPEATARRLQNLVWGVVTSDPRTGVSS